MDDLTAFLNARYDEAEASAKAALGSGDGAWRAGYRPDEDIRFVVFDSREVRGGAIDEGTLRHIAANDPAHRLADIALKRAILAEHRLTVTKAETYRFDSHTGEPIPERYDGDCEICGWFDPEQGGCATVRHLGTEFAGHQGYRPAWKPGA